MLNDGVIQKSDFREGTARSVPKVAAIADGRGGEIRTLDLLLPKQSR